MTKELILKKNNTQITLMDKNDIQDRIDEAVANNNPGNVNILVTYDDDTTETLHLRGYTTWSSGGSADSSSDD